MASGYKFSIRDSAGNATDTVVDFEDMFVKKDSFYGNTLWTWGHNGSGALGLGDVNHRYAPTKVGGLVNCKQVSAGFTFTAAIRTNGTLWLWGHNDYGKLGQGDQGYQNNRSSPVQVVGHTNWKQVECGWNHIAAIKTNGTLWTWGSDLYGEAGDGSTGYPNSIMTPVQVGSLTNWKQVDCGQFCTAAIKTDGTLWTWGLNSAGNLGLGDITHRSSPVQVGSLTNWKQVSTGNNHTAAIKTDGTLWSWGSNNQGQLGQGDLVHRSSPVQVGSLTNWKQVSANQSFSAAIKTDGTLWTWGYNSSGQLGHSDSTNRSSPVQVGTLTNWKQVSAGGGHIAVIKTDGTLWSCGYNDYGQAVSGGNFLQQIGVLTNWQQVSADSYHTVGITSPD